MSYRVQTSRESFRRSLWLFSNGANIFHSDQHSTDPWGGRFHLRVEFELRELHQAILNLTKTFTPIADTFRMKWRITDASDLKRLAIFASREHHGFLELLWQRRAGDLRADIASSHEETSEIVQPWDVSFHYVPITPDTRDDAERQQLELVTGNIDLIVLARYMQVLSPTLVAQWKNQNINIHHSFLPAFSGANPYALAAERGVKLIGATAHDVTEELDAGPIIEQGVERVDHRFTTRGMRRIGAQIERSVLARAVIYHVEDRIVVDGNKATVFS